jgi:protease-4
LGTAAPPLPAEALFLVTSVKKRPLLIASLLLGGIFVFFLVLALAVASMTGQSNRFVVGDKIGVVEVIGLIASSSRTIEQLHSFRDDDSVKAIVLRVDSPGGGVGPSQEIHDEVRQLVSVKPVVVSMGSAAASGGYYIAAPADLIVANPGTITGSIGVIMEFTNIQDLLEKIGLRSQVVKSGDHKDIGSPVRPMTDEDRAILQSLIDDVHGQFISAVAEGRELDPQVVRELADGRIFTGRQAKEMGLVDELGGLQVAIRKAAELGGIEGEPAVIYPPKEKPGLMDFLIEESLNKLHHALRQERTAGLQYIWTGFN